MNPALILATSYRATVFAGTRPLASPGLFAGASVAVRWRAEFVGGPHHGRFVSGHLTRDEAVGALVREAARHCTTADAVVELVASLFDGADYRTADVKVGRAVRFANDGRQRRHPGYRVVTRDAVALRLHTPEGGVA